MKIVLLLLTLVSGSVSASDELILVPDKVIALWPDRPLLENQRYFARRKKNLTFLIRERRPSLELYQNPVSNKPSAAVIICPGGGYTRLVYDLEGTEIAHWLNQQGFTALVLRYTIPKKGDTAFEDVQRAMGLVRYHAAEWNIQQNNIGIIGFSAGAHLAARLSTNWRERIYAPIDDADFVNIRPDFTALIYPALMSPIDKARLVPGINVDGDTPPTFLVQSLDDEYINSSQAYYKALTKANVKTEIHLYNQGGHGYGIRPTDYKVGEWPDRYKAWLTGIVN
jgi:acetyl esterase/lipase